MKLLVLDRDGVINHDSPNYIKTPGEWLPIDGSLEAIARLNHAGYRVVLATNQAGIGRGLFDHEALYAIHGKMQRLLAAVGGRIDAIFFCPHGPDAGCRCRKPRPGLLEQIGEHYAVDTASLVFVGDSMRDVEAARAASAKSVLLLTGNGKKTVAENSKSLENVAIFDDLSTYVAYILKNC